MNAGRHSRYQGRPMRRARSGISRFQRITLEPLIAKRRVAIAFGAIVGVRRGPLDNRGHADRVAPLRR